MQEEQTENGEKGGGGDKSVWIRSVTNCGVGDIINEFIFILRKYSNFDIAK